MRPLPLSHPPHRSLVTPRGAGLAYPTYASIHGHAVATVVFDGQGQPSLVAEVAPPEVVEKLRLRFIDVPATRDVTPISETTRPISHAKQVALPV